MSSINCEYKILTHDEYIEEKRNKPYEERFKAKKIYKPAKDKEKNKTERIQIRVSRIQKEYINELAAEKGVSVSKFILDLIEGMKN